MSFPLSDKAVKRMLMAGILPFALLAASTQAQEGNQWESGKNLYEKVCGMCHAPGIEIGPVLEGRGLPEPYIKAVVRNGFRAMPAFPASHIDDESITQVSEYLSTLPAPASQR